MLARMKYSAQTLERVREVVAQVMGADTEDLDPQDSLHLDSVKRIALIVELENAFQIEISPEHIVAEVFESLATLADLVEAHTS